MPMADGSLRPKLIPAEQIDPSFTRDPGPNGQIVSGIETDVEDRVTAFHILPEAPGAPFAMYGLPVRVPAQDVLHVFDPPFSGQVRGLSWLSPVLMKLRDRDEASDALLMLMKVSSLMTGFITDPEGGVAGFEGDANSGAVNVSLEPGAMRILPPGASVNFPAGPGPGPGGGVPACPRTARSPPGPASPSKC